MSVTSDLYKTIEGDAEGVFRDKGSRFIAYGFPFSNEENLKDVIARIKSMHPKARHHCWAYRLGQDRDVYRINDDGEPAGTAGRPILNCLLSADVTDIIVVVVRYFGGTLLGVPGLINAYKQATLECLENATIVEKTVNHIYQIRFDYLSMNDIMKMIKEHEWRIIHQNFDLDCTINIELRKNDVNLLEEHIKNLENINLKQIH